MLWLYRALRALVGGNAGRGRRVARRRRGSLHLGATGRHRSCGCARPRRAASLPGDRPQPGNQEKVEELDIGARRRRPTGALERAARGALPRGTSQRPPRRRHHRRAHEGPPRPLPASNARTRHSTQPPMDPPDHSRRWSHAVRRFTAGAVKVKAHLSPRLGLSGRSGVARIIRSLAHVRLGVSPRRRGGARESCAVSQSTKPDRMRTTTAVALGH